VTRDEELRRLNTDLVHNLVKDKEAYSYLQGRGLTSETIWNWELGYCPMEWNHSLRGRVTFPIRDSRGYLVSIGGRILPQYFEDKSTPKYYNLPYSKASTLFGLQKCLVTRGIRKQRLAVVVEDYFGVLVAHQTGYENVVSVCGSFFTEAHLGMLLREAEFIVVAFDNDEGGEKGWESVKEMSLKYDYPIFQVKLDRDLDEVLLQDREWLKEACQNVIFKLTDEDSLWKSWRDRLARLAE